MNNQGGKETYIKLIWTPKGGRHLLLLLLQTLHSVRITKALREWSVS